MRKKEEVFLNVSICFFEMINGSELKTYYLDVKERLMLLLMTTDFWEGAHIDTE
jgi:hypothetical protein